MSKLESLPRPEPLFVIDLEDTTNLSKILGDISGPDDSSTWIFSSDGLRLVVDGDRTSQVSVFFAASTFSRYCFRPNNCIRYTFSLKDFIETTNLLNCDDDKGDNRPIAMKTSLKMAYEKPGDPLRLWLENGTNLKVHCELKEYSCSQMQTLMGFSDLEETAEIELHSKEFYRYISGLDFGPFTTHVNIVFESGDIPMRIMTDSPQLGEVELAIKADLIKRTLTLPNNHIFNFNYKSKYIAPALEALKTSNNVRIKCGSSGLLLVEHGEPSIQYFVLSEAESNN